MLPPEGGSLQIGAPPRPRKHGLKLGLWEESSLGSEPRWNADRCAHPAGCAAVPGGTARGALRLSAFRFLYFYELAKSVADSEKAGTTPSFSVGHSSSH